ncbi:MAG: hypothetical protein KW802_04225 [Candidatus Doudnabacteria bacterium]|nr:hypothetical protein [Candidatus Doudnabacteria bacterium]
MMVEKEQNYKEQYANWHPTPENSEKILETENFETGKDAIFDYVKKHEPETSEEAEERNKGRSFYEKFSPQVFEKVKEIGALLAVDNAKDGEASFSSFLQDAKSKAESYFSDRIDEHFKDSEKNQASARKETGLSKKEKFLKLAIDAIDFVPIVGSAKMVGEGLAGQTMSGEKLSRNKRMIKTAEGAVFLALDLTGIGMAATEGMKAGSLVTRSAALMRKLGMSREIYMPVFKTGQFLLRDSVAGKLADKSFDAIIQARKAHSNNFREKAKEAIFEKAATEEEELARAA